jgi:chromosome segregation ATPase
MIPVIQLDPEAVRNGVYAAIGAGAGASLKAAVDWWIRRSERRETADDRRQERERAIADANDALAEKLREELRRELARRDIENQQLRERLTASDERQRQSDDRVSQLIGQVTELNKINRLLRDENIRLVEKSAQESYRLGELARNNADQALKISVMENQLVEAKDRIGVLEAALRKANIDVPEPRRRGDTGPLKGPEATGTLG